MNDSDLRGKARALIEQQVLEYGADILRSTKMQSEKTFMQHGDISCYAHSFLVACVSVRMACAFRLRVNIRSLVRGALLHDFFLYDWHMPHPDNKLHAFRHPAVALRNASREFQLSPIERDVIAKHMFPLNINPPRHMESLLVCLADKYCAVCETFAIPAFRTSMKLTEGSKR